MDLKIQDVQITLDGSFDEYASRKSYVDQDENIYYKILQTIGKLARNGISVQVRMNIDRNNRESILTAVTDIAELFNDNSQVKCYPAFLTGTSDIHLDILVKRRIFGILFFFLIVLFHQKSQRWY